MMTTKQIQKMIYSLGLKNIIVDGKNGEQTKLYVKGLQYALGLKIDGIFGPKTMNAVEKYKLDGQVKHFKNIEFMCKCGCRRIKLDNSLKLYLEIVRYHFRKSIYINSGYRCPAWNKKVGGASKSQHMLGKAADIRVHGVSAAKVSKFCSNLMIKHGGVSLSYPTFTHIDTRNYKARW